MARIKTIDRLRKMLQKFGFITKDYKRNRIVVAEKNNYPRLFFKVSAEDTVEIMNMWQMNTYSKKHLNEVLEFINRLNENTILSRFYLTKEAVLISEAFLLTLDNEPELKTILEMINYDMNTLLKKDGTIIKFLEQK